MPPVEFEKPGEKVLVTVTPNLAHGFAYEDKDQKLDDYYPGDTLLMEQASARMFASQGWIVAAAEGAKPGRASEKEAPKQSKPPQK
jgi:hypothetical protein